MLGGCGASIIGLFARSEPISASDAYQSTMAIDAEPETPNYLTLSAEERRARAETLREHYADCDLCGWECGVDRTAGETGACDLEDVAVVAASHPHHGEEGVLRGTGGSGTIFLANCNLACVFCQNHDISQGGRGRQATPEEIAEMALDLQSRGCHNVNFVSPTHVSPHLVEAVAIAADRGLDVPIVWNCGGYERPEVVDLLDGFVDVYMPDVKWADDEAAALYSKAPKYWEHVRGSVRRMHEQVGDLRTDADGVATGGLLVRHLVMPNHVESSKRVLEFVANEISRNTYLNVMAQYRPAYQVPGSDRYAAIDRRVTADEYRSIVEYGRELGLTRMETSPGYR
jgi:putative pyruvate formate lyase activating enzyme